MNSPVKVSIPNPCSEKWDEMKINDCGRFCSSCEKTVVDFTKMDDTAFIAYFRNSRNPLCGRFTERQLSIDVSFPSKPLLPLGKISKYVAASMITVAGLSGKIFAQENTTIVQTSAKPDATKKKDSGIINNSTVIKGRILDENNEGIPAASISIPALNTSTIADVDGNFEITINGIDPATVYYDLQVNTLGYPTKIQPVNIFTHPDIIMIQFDEKEVQYLGGAVTIIKVTKWKRFKWWVKNNFL